MPRHKILITVTTYPQPSRSHDELVCTAGVLETGEWLRIYPVPLSFLVDLKETGKLKKVKYTWLELDLEKRKDDFRPESHSPLKRDFSDLKLLGHVNTDSNWLKRKEYCLKNVYTNMSVLITASKEPRNISLATFKPTTIIGLEWENEDREWKKEWQELRKQYDMFAAAKPADEVIPKKLPYKFKYVFLDEAGKKSKLMIEDWEIGALYWNCLKQAEGDERKALQLVKAQYDDNFKTHKDIYFFLGTTKAFHKRSRNPFIIIGVFYPKKEAQGLLF
jgi:hypothetical protein